ncbi:MAG: signal peptidase I [Candidatus Cloacimonadota bacterium]|nr:MAG: signal peptidase I [Candidatus Cloacimonadota bacterium]
MSLFKKKKKIIRKRITAQEYLESILFAFVVAMIIRNYTFQNFKIPSSSMESTLLIGDYLVADKVKYLFTDPKREDIVTFRYPADPLVPEPRDRYAQICGPVYWDKDKNFFTYHAKKNVVKRVIGVAGDSIRIVNKRVYLNGKPFDRDYAQYIDKTNIAGKEKIIWDSSREYSDSYYGKYDGKTMGTRDNFGPVVVPEGYYFVLGDNRDVSADSRYWGFLNRKDITGRPWLIFFSAGEDPAKTFKEMYYRQKNMIKSKTKIRWDRCFRPAK